MVQMWMIDTPSPFVPKSELLAFLERMNAMPDKHLPEVRNAIKTVEDYLRKGDSPPSSNEMEAATAAFMKATDHAPGLKPALPNNWPSI